MEQSTESKASKIESCLQNQRVNLWELREFALSSNGLVNGGLRRRVWKKLVGLGGDRGESDQPVSSLANPGNRMSLEDKELDLIKRDAGRSVIYRYLDCSSNTAEDQRRSLESVLASAVGRPLAKGQSKTHYYQGLHDVAGAFLYQIDDVEETSELLRRVCHSYLRDPLHKDFSQLSWFVSEVLPCLLQQVDPALFDFFRELEVDLSSIVLPWLITLFTHDIADPEVSARLIDAFLAAHATFPIYFVVAMMTHPRNREKLAHVEPDACMISMVVQEFPSSIGSDLSAHGCGKITCQELIDEALDLMQRCAPRKLVRLAAGRSQSLDQTEFMTKASKVALLRAPQSWALASSVGGNDTVGEHLISERAGCPQVFPKAWIATGVERIMRGVPSSEPRKRQSAVLTSLSVVVPAAWAFLIRLVLGWVTAQYMVLKGLKESQRLLFVRSAQALHDKRHHIQIQKGRNENSERRRRSLVAGQY